MTTTMIEVMYINKIHEKTAMRKISSFIVRGCADYINITDSTFKRLQTENDGGVYSMNKIDKFIFHF